MQPHRAASQGGTLEGDGSTSLLLQLGAVTTGTNSKPRDTHFTSSSLFPINRTWSVLLANVLWRVLFKTQTLVAAPPPTSM